jgi:hypothetical protein
MYAAATDAEAMKKTEIPDISGTKNPFITGTRGNRSDRLTRRNSKVTRRTLASITIPSTSNFLSLTVAYLLTRVGGY